MDTIISNLGWIILLGIVLYHLYSRITNHNPYGITSKYVGTLIFDDSNLIDIVTRALENSGFRHVKYDTAESRFYAVSTMSMWSWGEHVMIDVENDGRQTRLWFTSVCALPIQIYDWGKNMGNFRRFHREMRKLTGPDRAGVLFSN